MNSSENNTNTPAVNSAPLTDIIFIFLFFFIIVSTFANPNIKKVNNAYCPSKSDAQPQKPPIVITITAEGSYCVAGKVVIDAATIASVKNPKDEKAVFALEDSLLTNAISNELMTGAANKNGIDSSRAVVINCDKAAPSGTLMVPLHAAAELGLGCGITYTSKASL